MRAVKGGTRSLDCGTENNMQAPFCEEHEL